LLKASKAYSNQAIRQQATSYLHKAFQNRSPDEAAQRRNPGQATADNTPFEYRNTKGETKQATPQQWRGWYDRAVNQANTLKLPKDKKRKATQQAFDIWNADQQLKDGPRLDQNRHPKIAIDYYRKQEAKAAKAAKPNAAVPEVQPQADTASQKQGATNAAVQPNQPTGEINNAIQSSGTIPPVLSEGGSSNGEGFPTHPNTKLTSQSSEGTGEPSRAINQPSSHSGTINPEPTKRTQPVKSKEQELADELADEHKPAAYRQPAAQPAAAEAKPAPVEPAADNLRPAARPGKGIEGGSQPATPAAETADHSGVGADSSAPTPL
jgi:hypothetical protein